jgi:hypothetical protein
VTAARATRHTWRHTRASEPLTLAGMEEARRVLERLDRIDRLRAGGASRLVLLAELRKLVDEGEAWVAAEAGGTQRARDALDACRGRLEDGGGGIAVAHA